MIDCTTVLESAEYISNNAKEVSIRKDLIKPCAEKVDQGLFLTISLVIKRDEI